MPRRKTFNELEVQLASSILWYDHEEMDRFLEIYDSIVASSYMILDGMFGNFVEYSRKFDFESEPDDGEKRRQHLIEFIQINNQNVSSKTKRENFDLWFQQVLETDVPLELADDILHHLIWDEFKNAIEKIDASTLSFKEKLKVKPKMPDSITKTKGLIDLEDISVEDLEPTEISERFTSGLEDLDQVLEFKTGNFVVVAARPGVGKSLFMLQMGAANAEKGVKSVFISLEMKMNQIIPRIMNYYTEENIREQHKDDKGILDVEGYTKAFNQVKAQKGYKRIMQYMKLYEPDTSSADALIDDIEKLVKENNFQVVFLDYLQLLRFVGMDEFASLRKLTNALKNLARRLNVLIVTGSQVSRSSTEKGLYLSDLFGSSTIEADTDIVIGLENPKERKHGERAILNVKVMKNRDGDLSELKYMADYSICRLYFNDN